MRYAEVRIICCCLFFLSAAYISTACNVLQRGEGQLKRQLVGKGMAENTVPLDSATVEYWVGGIGPTLLLVHGFAGNPMSQWSNQVEALIADHRLIIPNLLWFGDSYSETSDFSVDQQVRVLVELLNYLAADKVNVVGLGYGGFVAYELAATHGNLVDSVVFVSSPGRGYTEYDYSAMCNRYQVESIDKILLPTTREGVKKLLSITYHKTPKLMFGYALDNFLHELKDRHREEKVNLLNWLEGHLDDLDKRTEQIEVPSLVVWGAEDRLFPVELGKRLADRLGSNGELRVIEEAGHCPNQEQGPTFNSLLLDFLKENSDR